MEETVSTITINFKDYVHFIRYAYYAKKTLQD